MNKRYATAYILVAGVLAVLFLLWAFSRRMANNPVTQEPSTALREVQAEDAQADTGGEIQLTAAQMENFGVRLATAKSGRLRTSLNFSGDVAINTDGVAHIVPRVTGVVREVRKKLGDRVRQGEVMAVLESRELADSKAAFLAARQRVALAESGFSREEQLWKKKISAEQDFFQTRNALAESRIELQTAEQKLLALGLSAAQVTNLVNQAATDLTRYEMLAPFNGTIVEKHTDLGEVLKDDTPGFKIADLSVVWGNLDVQQRDIPFIHLGQRILISGGHGIPDLATAVSYIEPLADEQTRTIHARVELPNADGRWHPGMFITGRVAIEDYAAAVLVPNEALIMLDGKHTIFLQSNRGFKPQTVEVGRTGDTHTEILSGLKPGQSYVMQGAFVLKSELDKPRGEE